MKGGTLSRRYAKALLELADEQRQLDKVSRDLSELLASWQVSPELGALFENPAVRATDRKGVIEKISERMGLSGMVKNTMLLMSDRRRLRHLPNMIEAFHALAEEKAGRVRAEVVTAAPMPDNYFAELQRTLETVTGKKVVLVRRQDASLIAGVVTRVGDKVFDGSVRARLDELKEELLAP